MSQLKHAAGTAVLALLSLPALHFMLPADALAQATPPAGPGPAIPSSIVAEHEELHARLAKAVRSGGKTGTAAKEVEKLLAPHFDKEEQYAMPPLGLLSALASGKMPDESTQVIKMTDRLKAEMPEMLSEHKAISAATQRLRKAALDEHQPDAVQFADALLAHARQEEQILYPSAILVGEYLKLKR